MLPPHLLDSKQRAAALIQVERELALKNLATFTRYAWSQIEPNRLIWNWHLDAISECLQAVEMGQIRNLLINVPPGCMKSLSASSFFPAWVWARDPSRRFIASTYAQVLSLKNAKLHRQLVQSQWYTDRFPDTKLARGSDTSASLFRTTEGGFRLSTSVSGSVTGFHADVIICDDLVKARDAEGRAAVSKTAINAANEHRFKTLMTRRADPNKTAFVTIMQRLHFEDPAQQCIDSGDHVSLILPMNYDPDRKCIVDLGDGRRIEDPRTRAGELLWPERFNAETVDTLRKELGEMGAAAQLDQNPVPREGAIFKSSDFRFYDECPYDRAHLITVDCTFKDSQNSDYVVAQAWAVNKKARKYYLLDQVRGKWKVQRTAAEVAGLVAKWDCRSIRVEDKANGPAIVQILSGNISGIREWSPGRSSKTERAEAVVPLICEHRVYLPREAPWLEELIQELTHFPVGKHDDQVDAMVMALMIMYSPRRHKQIIAYDTGLT